jgi:hypothetical protein
MIAGIDRFNDLIRPNPPNRERAFVASALHIGAVAALATEAIETEGCEVRSPPAILVAVFGIIVTGMAGEPRTRVVDPLLERVKPLVAEGRLNEFAHDTIPAARSASVRVGARAASPASVMRSSAISPFSTHARYDPFGNPNDTSPVVNEV